MSDTHPHEPVRDEEAVDETTPPASDRTAESSGSEVTAPDQQWAPHEPERGDTRAETPADDIENTVPMSAAERVEASAPTYVAHDDAPGAEIPALIEPAPFVPHSHIPVSEQPADESSPVIAKAPADFSRHSDADADPEQETSEAVDETPAAEQPEETEPPVVEAPPVFAAQTPVAAAAPSTEVALNRSEPSDAVRNQYVITSPEQSTELARAVAVEPAHVSATEPVLATTDPGAVESGFATPAQRVVYVEAPTKPKKKGNRGVGALFALLSGVLYAVLFAAIVFVLFYATTGRAVTNFVGQTSFFVPILLFVIAFIVLVLIVNRAGWWAYALGSIFVGVFVYFATIGVLLLLDGVLQVTPDQATAAFGRALANPLVIASALLARELSLWVGLAISARARRVKARNQKALDEFNREAEERKAGYGRAAETNATATV